MMSRVHRGRAMPLAAGAAVATTGLLGRGFVASGITSSGAESVPSAGVQNLRAGAVPMRPPAGCVMQRAASAAGAAVAGVAAALAAGGHRVRPRGVKATTACQFFSGGGSESTPTGTIYDYTVKDIDGNDVPLKRYEGKVVLIVNVASK